MNSDNLTVAIDINELLKKRLIISEIFSKNTVFLDSQIRRLPLPDTKKQHRYRIGLSVLIFLKAMIDKQTSSLAIGDISTTMDSALSFNKEYEEIDGVILQSQQVFSRKEKGMKLSNEVAYEINQINPDKIKTVNEIVSVQEKLPKISKKISELDSNTSALKIIYDQSLLKINEINATINQKIEDSFSFNVSSNENKISSKNIDLAASLLTSFMKSFKTNPIAKVDQSEALGDDILF